MKEIDMKTTETEVREEPATLFCHILAMPLKHWFSIIILILCCMALCAAVFAGEPGQRQYSCESKDRVLFSDSNPSDEACEAADSERLSYRDVSMTENQTEGEKHGE
jgi:hypothetical protein